MYVLRLILMLNHVLICSHTKIVFSKSLLIVNFLGFYMLKLFFTLNLKAIFFFLVMTHRKRNWENYYLPIPLMSSIYPESNSFLGGLTLPAHLDGITLPPWEVRFHHKLWHFVQGRSKAKTDSIGYYFSTPRM